MARLGAAPLDCSATALYQVVYQAFGRAILIFSLCANFRALRGNSHTKIIENPLLPQANSTASEHNYCRNVHFRNGFAQLLSSGRHLR
jgi:hypothetical protein